MKITPVFLEIVYFWRSSKIKGKKYVFFLLEYLSIVDIIYIKCFRYSKFCNKQIIQINTTKKG